MARRIKEILRSTGPNATASATPHPLSTKESRTRVEPLGPNDPTHIGRNRLTHLLGTGGMGKVYLARTNSGRKIVVKVIRADHADKDEYRTRFTREVAAARKVGGFYTAQVVDADTDADEPWIASDYIPGPSLHQAVTAHGPLPERSLRVLALGLAEGLTAIHEHGLVHRDLKPANIILADDGPRIIDFGISRPTEDTRITHTGTLLGTPAYMAPEQAEGEVAEPAVDIFSLGTVLHFAATGINPFEAPTFMATLRRLIGPVPPVPNNVSEDLRCLINGCWNHDPAKRPTLVRMIAFLGELDSDQACPPFQPLTSPYRTEASFEDSYRNKRLPTPSNPKKSSNSFISKPLENNKLTNLNSIETSARASASELWHSANPSPMILRGHWGLVLSAEFSPDDTTIVTASIDQTARLWDTQSGQQINSLRHDDAVSSAAFDPTGNIIATTSNNSMAYLWDVTTGEIITPLTGHKGGVESVAFSPDGKLITTTGEDRSTLIWNTKNGDHIHSLFGHGKTVESVKFSPSGELLATASSGGTVRVWDAHRWILLYSLQHDSGVSSVSFSADSSTIATASSFEAYLWNAHTQDNFLTLEHSNWANSANFSPDGTTLAVSCSDRLVHLWNIKNGKHITHLNGSKELAVSSEFNSKGTAICGSSYDNTALLWKI